MCECLEKYSYFDTCIGFEADKTAPWPKWSEVVAVGQNLRSISSQAGLQLLNVLVNLTLS